MYRLFLCHFEYELWILRAGRLQGGLHSSLAFTHLCSSLHIGNGRRFFCFAGFPCCWSFQNTYTSSWEILCESEGLLNVTYAFPVLPSASVTHLDAHLGDWVVAPWKQTLFVALETSKSRNWFQNFMLTSCFHVAILIFSPNIVKNEYIQVRISQGTFLGTS